MTRKRHAEVAGAGFAGLTVAAALAQRGWTVRVHERTSEVRAFGAGIWMWENGVRVLNAIGAADEALADCTETPSWTSWDAKGRVIDQIDFSGGHARVFCLPRQQLLQAMKHAAERGGVEIVTSSEAVGAAPDGTLELADGRQMKADLVIGCDGVNSNVRDSLGLLRSRKRHVDGAIRVLVDHEPGAYEKQENRRVREWWSGNRRLLYTPCNARVYYLCLTMAASDKAATAIPVRKDEWIKTFPHLDAMISSIGDDGRYDRFETTKLSRWSAGRVAILGDAAHGMTPGLGQGCGTAICNGVALAAMLDDSDDIETTLMTWEANRRRITEHTQIWSQITWPLIPWPHWCAKAYYNLPFGAAWIARQRRRPSEQVPYGTENTPRWAAAKQGVEALEPA